jgi:hypothetical protein
MMMFLSILNQHFDAIFITVGLMIFILCDIKSSKSKIRLGKTKPTKLYIGISLTTDAVKERAELVRLIRCVADRLEEEPEKPTMNAQILDYNNAPVGKALLY